MSGIGNIAKGILGYQDAPAAPDYASAANQTAANNLKAAQEATKANRINQYNPYGSLTYSQDANGNWSQNTGLGQTGQNLMNAQGAAIGRMADAYSNPFDYQSVNDVENQAYKAQTDRLDPQWAHQSEQMDAKLANQGIAAGTEAYDNAMRSFNQGKNDAYGQARLNAINTAPQTLGMAQSIYNMPMQQAQGMLGMGSQYTQPQFQGYNTQATTAGADTMGAAQAGYNAQLQGVNANNAFLNNIIQAGGKAASAAGGAGGAAAGGAA